MVLLPIVTQFLAGHGRQRVIARAVWRFKRPYALVRITTEITLKPSAADSFLVMIRKVKTVSIIMHKQHKFFTPDAECAQDFSSWGLDMNENILGSNCEFCCRSCADRHSGRGFSRALEHPLCRRVFGPGEQSFWQASCSVNIVQLFCRMPHRQVQCVRLLG